MAAKPKAEKPLWIPLAEGGLCLAMVGGFWSAIDPVSFAVTAATISSAGSIAGVLGGAVGLG